MNRTFIIGIVLIIAIALELFVGPGTMTREIIQLRLYRVLLGIFAGSVLAFSGGVLQSLFGNPLVEPYTLGSASGAALGTAVGITLFGYISPVFAFLGALGIGVIVFAIARTGGGLLRDRLILAGVVMSFLCSSLVMIIMIAGKKELYEIIYMLMGYLGLIITPQNRLMILVLLIGSVVLILYLYRYCREFDIITSGTETAMSLGIDLQRFSIEVFIIITLLVSFVVSIVGAIGFVGLVIPHIAKILFGPKHSKNLAGSLFLGMAFVLFADGLARNLTVYELPTGIITSLIGVPFFVYLYQKK